MPEKRALEAAREDAAQGRSASTQAGEFVREEVEHVRKKKHGASSTKQVIAIGLSRARRAGVRLRPPKKGKSPAATRKKAKRDVKKAGSRRKPSRTRSRAISKALRREGHRAASRKSLARQARASARRRGKRALWEAARKAARTRKLKGR